MKPESQAYTLISRTQHLCACVPRCSLVWCGSMQGCSGGVVLLCWKAAQTRHTIYFRRAEQGFNDFVINSLKNPKLSMGCSKMADVVYANKRGIFLDHLNSKTFLLGIFVKGHLNKKWFIRPKYYDTDAYIFLRWQILFPVETADSNSGLGSVALWLSRGGVTTEGCLPPKVVSQKVIFQQRLSSREGRLPPMVVFHWRLSSTEGRLPPKVIFHRRMSSTKSHLPPTMTP